MSLPVVLSAVSSGGLVGFTLGLVGGGGSILATPLLLYAVGVTNPHVAIGTSALAVSLNAYANLVSHALKGHVWWRCALIFASVGAFGAWLGSSLGLLIDGQKLLLLFGFVMLAVAGLMLKPRRSGHNTPASVDGRMCALTAAMALLAGGASGFFGIGGGFLIVPALVFATGMPMLNAIASSLLAVGTFGLTTGINYALAGMVDWTLAAEFIAGGIVGGVAGMALATRLAGHKSTLNRIFAALIFVVALYVIYRARTA